MRVFVTLFGSFDMADIENVVEGESGESVEEQLRRIISSHPVVLFMKGTPDFPQCGFSMKTAQALKACDAEFVYVDVLAAPEARGALPGISNWPTFPQVFVGGELVGGCDIALEMYQSGELKELLSRAGGVKGDG